jgi:DMSO/TMAO reductase YedYZ molybdopterin-dependent catalytic subunit
LRRISRRAFVRLALAGAGLSFLNNCGPQQTSLPDGAPGTPATRVLPLSTAQPTIATPASTPTLTSPTVTPTRAILTSANVEGFYVRYYQRLEAVDPEQWTLAIEGLVRRPQKLSLPDVLAMPRISQVSRMKCVECWSAVAQWEGVHLSTLMELADPDPKAQWVHFQCADGYYESMSIEALLRERVLFVHHMNGEILPDLYGAPLRLMVPSLYGYKSAKAIVAMQFAEEELIGFWPKHGPYTEHGRIRAGRDYPLDLKESREIRGGGEIFYPDGIESQGRDES